MKIKSKSLLGENGRFLRRHARSRYPLLWQKEQRYNKQEPQQLKLQKPQKLLKLFCHTATIESILHGLNGV